MSEYVGPEWVNGVEPEACCHFFCANDDCPYSYAQGEREGVPCSRKYRVPGGYICELCAEAYDETYEGE